MQNVTMSDEASYEDCINVATIVPMENAASNPNTSVMTGMVPNDSDPSCEKQGKYMRFDLICY